mmetsp:Transcript_23305/g.39916  ORF Transcript_23305/g.39916 Transcript_23305/m.39916 type:complete len:312 (-) Transcript_23305:461-1396(-)
MALHPVVKRQGRRTEHSCFSDHSLCFGACAVLAPKGACSGAGCDLCAGSFVPQPPLRCCACHRRWRFEPCARSTPPRPCRWLSAHCFALPACSGGPGQRTERTSRPAWTSLPRRQRSRYPEQPTPALVQSPGCASRCGVAPSCRTRLLQQPRTHASSPSGCPWTAADGRCRHLPRAASLAFAGVRARACHLCCPWRPPQRSTRRPSGAPHWDLLHDCCPSIEMAIEAWRLNAKESQLHSVKEKKPLGVHLLIASTQKEDLELLPSICPARSSSRCQTLCAAFGLGAAVRTPACCDRGFAQHSGPRLVLADL